MKTFEVNYIDRGTYMTIYVEASTAIEAKNYCKDHVAKHKVKFESVKEVGAA